MTNGKRGPLYLILFAALMAGAGNGISIVAFPWLVLQRNGSALDASIVAMAGTLPLLVATLIAGAAVDYLGRRRVSMISDALSALSVAAVPVLALTFGVHVINVAVLAGAGRARRVLRPGGDDGARDDAARGRHSAPAGRWTTPTASTRRCSTWPTSSDPASAAC